MDGAYSKYENASEFIWKDSRKCGDLEYLWSLLVDRRIMSCYSMKNYAKFWIEFISLKKEEAEETSCL
jgi:hypothetical protein